MAKPHVRKLLRVKKGHDSVKRTLRLWDEILTDEGVSMNSGLSDKLSYVGTSVDLIVIEKLQEN